MNIFGLYVPAWSILVVGIFLFLVVLILIRALKSTQTEQSGSRAVPSPEQGSSESAEEEEQRYAPKIGQEFAYYDGSNSPKFVVEDIDREENDLSGRILIPLPPESEVINIKVDTDDQIVQVVYKLPDRSVTHEIWYLENDPEELDDWNVLWDKIIAIPNMAF